MGRSRRDESVTAVVSVRLSAREQTELAAAIRSAEEKAGLAPGTTQPIGVRAERALPSHRAGEEEVMKRVKLPDFLTEAQIQRCMALWREHGPGSVLHKALLDEVVRPNMAAIDAKIGQPNVDRYIAYMIEHVLSEGARLAGAS